MLLVQRRLFELQGSRIKSQLLIHIGSDPSIFPFPSHMPTSAYLLPKYTALFLSLVPGHLLLPLGEKPFPQLLHLPGKLLPSIMGETTSPPNSQVENLTIQASKCNHLEVQSLKKLN